MAERYAPEDLKELGLSVEPCPLCDDDTLVTKDDVLQHLLSTHPPTYMATWIALMMFLGDES